MAYCIFIIILRFNALCFYVHKVVPEDKKDEKYWEKRNQNTESTRRSRENKRLTYNFTVSNLPVLEQTNKDLKKELAAANQKHAELKEQLALQEARFGNLPVLQQE